MCDNANSVNRQSTLPFIFLPIILLLICLPAHTKDGITEKDDFHAFYDWVPLDALSENQQQDLNPGCRGRYVDPQHGLMLPSSPLEEQDLDIEADSSEFNQGDHARLEGDVSLQQGLRLLKAQYLHYDLKEQRLTLKDDVTIRQPGLLIRGQYAEIHSALKQARFSDATFLLHQEHLRGGAGSIEQQGNTITLKDGEFTSCEPGRDSWSLHGKEIILDNEKQQGTGRHIVVKLGKVPVFYWPYLRFPLGDQRQTGFLYPSISSSDNGGLDISVPFYWNIAPNYDATLAPRHISGRGAMLNAQFRHLHTVFRTQLDGSFLPDDGGGGDEDAQFLIDQGLLSEAEAFPNRNRDRWLVSLQQEGGLNSRLWWSNINFNKVSDLDYFRDLGTASFAETTTNYLNQSIEVGLQLDHWRMGIAAENYQVLLKDAQQPYRILPRLSATGIYPIGPARLSLDHQYTFFSDADNESRITGSRLNTDYRLSFNRRKSWGFFNPEAGYQTLIYNLDDTNLASDTEQKPIVSAAQFSLDTGLIFEHPSGKWFQTLEPRLYYLFREKDDHDDLLNKNVANNNINFDTSLRAFSYSQLYRDSRFNGGDRIDDDHRVTVGLTSSWSNPETGQPVFSAQIGQILYLEDREVTLTGVDEDSPSSPVAAELNVFVGPLAQVYANMIYDDDANRLDRLSSGLHWHSQNYQKIANVSYQFVAKEDPSLARQDDLEQLDLSVAWPLNRQWQVMARANYDLNFNQELEAFAGVEYNDCCYRLKLLGRRWLDNNIASLATSGIDVDELQYDQGVFIEVQLKGLGGSGDSVSRIVNDGIYGYREKEQYSNAQH